MDGECGLSQEILVIEHVDFIHHKAQKGEGRVADGELESLSGPGGIQTIISWRGRIRNTNCFESALLKKKKKNGLCMSEIRMSGSQT